MTNDKELVGRLRGEELVEHARKLRTDLNDTLPNGVGNTIDALAVGIEQLLNETERLTEAGAIFVDTANGYEAEGHDDDTLLYFSLGELKEFRAALTGEA